MFRSSSLSLLTVALVVFGSLAILAAPLGRAQGPIPVSTEVTPSDAEAVGPIETYVDFDSERAIQSQAIPLGELFEAGRVIAVVGEERVLVGDLIDPRKLTPEVLASREFELMLRKALAASVARKCLSQHFIQMQTSGKPKKERDDIRSKVKTKTVEIFRTQIMPEQLKRAKCETELEFIDMLEKSGTSLHALMRDFSEQMWAEQALREGVPEKPNVWLFELRDYYDEHPEQWDRAARVKFRILSALFKTYPTRDAAYMEIAAMGNEVFLGGASFDAVAIKRSSGFNASNGGNFDWTTRGALKSKVIEDAVFSIEKNALSPILEDSEGYHIVEVLEREDEYRMSFAQAQSEIRETLLKNKQEQQRKDYIQKIRENTSIWTRWPEDIPGSLDIATIQ